jgi:DNA-binding Lrp family transcriptional regulator
MPNTNDELADAQEERVLAHLIQKRTLGDTQKEIADALEMEGPAVRRTLDKMRNKGWIASGYTVLDLKPLGFTLRYRVDIWVAPRRLHDGTGGLPGDKTAIKTQKDLARYIHRILPAKKEFKESILVEDVKILLGAPADMSATVLAKNNQAMLEFVTEGLRMCGAVYQTASLQESWSLRDHDL